MNRRPLLASTAALAALSLAAASGSASGATATPAAGSATSTVSVLRVLAGGHELSAVDLTLRSDTTTSPRVSRVEVVPVTADGTAYGRQVVDQSNSPQGIAALSTPGALSPFASLTSPGLTVSATSVPSSQAGATSLGSVKVLGLPVGLGGALQVASAVSGTGGSSAGKTITLKNVSLPSIKDLLAALGLDLSKLPVGSLSTLVSDLGLVTSAVTTAQNAVDSAQSAVNAQVATLAGLTSTLTTDQGALATAQATLTTATAALNTLISASSALLTPLGITDITSLLGVAPGVLTTAEGLVPTLASTLSAYTSAVSAVSAAQALVTAAQAAVDAAQALLTTLQSTLTSALSTLLGTLTGVLDGTPLLSLAKLEISTRAAVTSAAAGGQTAEVVGGSITGLKVLGTDVLQSALGSTTVNLSDLVGSTLSKVTTAVSGLTGTLSSVLSSIPSLPVLSIPTPTIGVLTKTVGTSVSGGFGRAHTQVTGLSITLPAITLPTSVALPGAAGLPALTGVTQVAGQLTSAPVTLQLLDLQDQAAFRPASGGGSTGTPGSSQTSTSGGLPPTGLPIGLAVLSVALVGGAFALRRRLAPQG